jgi:phytoene dehydrogenase-like protein
MTTSPSVTDTADAVIIGAGHNGLVSAALLADAGWDVVALEAQAAPGGAVKSAELIPGFVSDLYSAFYPHITKVLTR